MFYLTKETIPIFVPLGFIGLYRWFWFLVKLIAWFLYKPLKPLRRPRYISSRDVTIVVPTIDCGPEIHKALLSWLANEPFEIIFVTVDTAKTGLERLANAVDPKRATVRVVTVHRANKRSQMVAGANRVKTDITVFCDDDVIWGSEMLKWCLAPFEDGRVGGVGTSQRVVPLGKRMTIWEILAAYRLTMRNVEITASTYIDGGVCCLSGRTAVYRTNILRDPDFQWKFTHEFWLGKYHQHSGDDKFLTRWLHSHNWRTHIQACPQAELQSTFKDDWRFLKQLLRWTRNTWRSDSRSLFTERHIWTRYPYTAFTMLDKMFNPITLLAGPITVIYLIVRTYSVPHQEHQVALWVVVVSYIVWLFVTRMIKYSPHFVRRPQDIVAIPVWLVFSIYFAIMKIYCLFTLHKTGWGTRSGAEGGTDPEDEKEIYRPMWLKAFEEEKKDESQPRCNSAYTVDIGQPIITYTPGELDDVPLVPHPPPAHPQIYDKQSAFVHSVFEAERRQRNSDMGQMTPSYIRAINDPTRGEFIPLYRHDSSSGETLSSVRTIVPKENS
ncbi:hypothetical protein HDU85_004458 [Gaertneriomyces sp. JEL0708]|nr:hypothetical protein HDU85_004458 [Gaertneriomyces sp. JEL0708]